MAPRRSDEERSVRGFAIAFAIMFGIVFEDMFVWMRNNPDKIW